MLTLIPFSRNAARVLVRPRPDICLGARVVVFAAAVVALALLAPSPTFAGSATWSAMPASGNWNTADNWTPMTIPNGPSDTATFSSSSQTSISLSAHTELRRIVFDPGASGYSITAAPASQLLLNAGGITNNSGITQNFVTVGDGAGNTGFISLFSNATVEGLITFTNNGGVVAGASRGATQFLVGSTSGNSTFINKGGDVSGASGGITRFSDGTTAGGSLITNDGSAFSDYFSSGSTEFADVSTAAFSTIVNNGSTVAGGAGGLLLFGGSSKPGAANLIAHGGLNGGQGGTIIFLDNSANSAGTNPITSRVQLFGNGNVDISAHGASQVTLGSLEGDGNVFLGGRTLVVGSNPLDTTFSGVIQDGGINFNTGGRLIKIGAGTFRLTRANTYTGGTTISNAGRLLANNSTGSGTGSGPLTVGNYGSVLGGTGTISGQIDVYQGAILLGGDPAAATGSLKLANNVILHPGAIIQLVLGPAGAHSALRRTGGSWFFANDQAFSFINLGAEPGFYNNIITGLIANPLGVESWTITSPGFAGTFTYDGGGNIDLTLTDAPPPTPIILGNISTRVRVLSGDKALIGGMIVTGTAAKRVILRAIGPSLSDFGVPEALVDPTLEFYQGNTLLSSNDDWRNSTQRPEIEASGFAPNSGAESAIIWTLMPDQGYTAIVRGKNGTPTGVGLVEVFDLDHGADSRLGNISTRGLVGNYDSAMIAGLIVVPGHGKSARILVRALGPTLSDLGVPGALANPTLDLVNSSGTVIRSNNDWKDDPLQRSEIEAAGLAPNHDEEAALVETVAPGAYTAIVRGTGATPTGVALVEVYHLP